MFNLRQSIRNLDSLSRPRQLDLFILEIQLSCNLNLCSQRACLGNPTYAVHAIWIVLQSGIRIGGGRGGGWTE